MCPVDSLFKMANNTVLRGEYVQTYRANTIVVSLIVGSTNSTLNTTIQTVGIHVPPHPVHVHQDVPPRLAQWHP